MSQSANSDKKQQPQAAAINEDEQPPAQQQQQQEGETVEVPVQGIEESKMAAPEPKDSKEGRDSQKPGTKTPASYRSKSKSRQSDELNVEEPSGRISAR